MYCDEVKNLLYEFIYEEFEEEKYKEVEQHLESCKECYKEYLELKKLLLEDMEPLVETKEQVLAPEALKRSIKKSLGKSYNAHFAKVASVVCILLFMIYVVPVAAYYLVENSPLAKYIKIDSGIVHDFEEGKGQLVNAEYKMKGVTFKLEGIIKGKDTMKVLFSTKVDEEKNFNYAMPVSGAIRVTDQFGSSYRLRGSAGYFETSKKSGEMVWVQEVENPKFWSYKLNFQITAMEIGNMEGEGENFKFKKERNIYGLWEVEVNLDRSLK
jgi:Putative zinc-finger